MPNGIQTYQTQSDSLGLRTVGSIVVKRGDQSIYQSEANEGTHIINLPSNISAKDSSLRMDMERKGGALVLIEQGAFVGASPDRSGLAVWGGRKVLTEQ
jgi:hypothetical protein